ncbi:MAG: triose-phosphate isomerase [Chloroflexota bacterium]
MANRQFVFGTNFKMNQTPQESVEFYRRLIGSTPIRPGIQLYVVPPVTSLAAVAAAAAADPANVWVGAQNMHWAADGAFTGEISARMLQALQVDLVLIGHAERRGLFNEQDVELNKKVHAAIEAGMQVLLCVGETGEERAFGVSAETVAKQLKIDLHQVNPASAAQILVAYEPVWSIGTGGIPATPDDIAPIASLIRETLRTMFGDSCRMVPILYGGSVNAENAGSFATIPEIDGLLVGRAGWTVESYTKTLEAALSARL